MTFRIVRLASVISALLSLSACQAEAPPQADAPPAAPAQISSPVSPLLPCGSGAPRVDRAQIYARLKADGVITEQMSDADAEQRVTDYIQQRQQAYKRCVKGVKP
ncbi:hypothetical protein JYB87_17995 [Shewanella avicenniae]|uniref:Lipoprotein n=1 Tax=Shewanella avicenniae TaxID=2814294 RepID=A0ABX7QQL9_9GAMM|nr:hypothetical protein [Shewanella avicenniae]QSX33574.1 hypothetical protein JYB87_17995 [Shewanella avicenniae]